MRRDSLASLADRVLRELDLDSSPEKQGSADRDIEVSSNGSDFHSEGLADQLAERIRRNEGGRYDFKTYVDPENR